MEGLRTKAPLRYYLNASVEAETWLLGFTVTLETGPYASLDLGWYLSLGGNNDH